MDLKSSEEIRAIFAENQARAWLELAISAVQALWGIVYALRGGGVR